MRILFTLIIILLLAIIVIRLFPRKKDEIEFTEAQKSRYKTLTWINTLAYIIFFLLMLYPIFSIAEKVWEARLEEGVLILKSNWMLFPTIILSAAIAILPSRWFKRMLCKHEEAAFEQYLDNYYLIPETRLSGIIIGLFLIASLTFLFIGGYQLKLEPDTLVYRNPMRGNQTYPLQQISKVDALPAGGFRVFLRSGATIETGDYIGDQDLFFKLVDQYREALPGKTVALVIHGGAGTILKSKMRPEIENRYTSALEGALKTGQEMLLSGHSAMDVVEAVIKILEDDSLFNAGRGAVLNFDGVAELDASLMDGKTGEAGAVSGVKTIRNPITLARAVMNKTDHVLLSGAGAEQLATILEIPMVDNEYFITEANRKRLKDAKAKPNSGIKPPAKMGTVGAVALDQQGNIAAGTSTGGMVNKKFGRIGDSPIIGAGTYANNKTCGISATGHGEFFMRNVVAFDIHALMAYRQFSLEQACKEVIQNKLRPAGGQGGVIGLDRFGNVVMEFNTKGMYRGFVKNEDAPEVAIYGD
jgi:beta-aspartyl-peptidase (threonine type)